MAVYLVTGGAGFIGSNIVEALVSRDEGVRVLDNFSTGKRENVIPFLDRIELIEGDVRSYHIVKDAVDGVDFILHQAALPSVPRSIKDPITTNEVNITGTLNILDAAKEAGVRRIVYASSSSIYGDTEILPKKEDMVPMPLSPYAVSKLAGEEYCHVFSRIYGIETICLRYFNVFGPRQDPTSQYSAVVPKFIDAMRQGKSPTVYGEGNQSRDFTHVDNVVSANLLACETDATLSGDVVNIACGSRITLLELVDLINECLATEIEPEFLSRRPGDVLHSMADIAKANRMLGYSVLTGFKEGIGRMIAGR